MDNEVNETTTEAVERNETPEMIDVAIDFADVMIQMRQAENDYRTVRLGLRPHTWTEESRAAAEELTRQQRRANALLKEFVELRKENPRPERVPAEGEFLKIKAVPN